MSLRDDFAFEKTLETKTSIQNQKPFVGVHKFLSTRIENATQQSVINSAKNSDKTSANKRQRHTQKNALTPKTNLCLYPKWMEGSNYNGIVPHPFDTQHEYTQQTLAIQRVLCTRKSIFKATSKNIYTTHKHWPEQWQRATYTARTRL